MRRSYPSGLRLGRPLLPVEGSTRGRTPANERRSYRLGGPGEELLMVKYQRGDRAAFQELVHRHQTAVFNFVLRLGVPSELVESVTQEVFQAVVRRAPSYQSDAPFAPWLYRIAREVCLAHLSEVPLVNSVTLGQQSRAESGPKSDVPMADLVMAALDAMGLELREVFLLRDICGLTLTQIAEVIGEAPLVVRTRLREAFERLQRAIAGRDEYQRQLR